MKRSSGVSSTGSVFDEESCGLMTHDLLLMGYESIQTLLGLSAWLSEDKAWSCDLEVGVLQGEVLLDQTLVNVNVSSLGGEQDYCGMLDSRLASCDGMVYLVAEKFDKDELDLLFEQVTQAKDGRVFTMSLALIGVDESSALYTNASEWADAHYGVLVSCIQQKEDNASLAQCVCNVAVCVHRTKATLSHLMAAQSAASSPCTSRHSGSVRSSRRGSNSSSLSCVGLPWNRSSSSRRKSSLSLSTTGSISSRTSKDEKRRSQYSATSNASQCSIM